MSRLPPFVALVAMLVPLAAQAQSHLGEMSLLGSYSKTTYGADSYATSKRYTASLGYNLTLLTQVEVAYTTVNRYFRQADVQSVTVEEQTLSASLVQTLVPPDWYFQPYVKGGAAQYNRRQNGSVNGIPTREVYTKSPSFVLGAGARVFFMRNFSFNAEFITYFPDLKWPEGKNNIAFEGGLSWHF
ncbi:MAG: porin family protein [Deltaproteobacteria bacterium]|nr:porin family protein [Deltaproteobacteria bacterium]